MKLAWALVWFVSTIGFVPVARTLLGGIDCTRHEDIGVWTWDRDSTSDYNLLTAEEQAAAANLYPGDYPCFEGIHLIVYVPSSAPPPPPPPHPPCT